MPVKTEIKFSIVIPCYNSERTIAEAVKSVLDQTVTAFEVIIVNDGSTDGSAAILESLAASDHRIRIITQANGGLSAARNSGIRAAKAPVIAFLDGDDRYHADCLEAHAANFARDLLKQNPVTACFAARREIFDVAGLFSTGMARVEDTEWLFRASLTAWRMVGIDRVLFDYRTSPGGLSSDLDGMLTGYDTFLAAARLHAPKLVAEVGAESRARMLLYLERRAIAFGRPRRVVGHYAWAAFKCCPSLILRDPVRVTAMLLAGFVPGVAGLFAPRSVHA